MNEKDLIDGWIVKYRDLSYWVIKGYSQPPNSLVAIPYRTSEGKRVNVEDYRLFTPPWLIRWVKCIGREAPLLSLGDIIQVYDPFIAYKLRAKDLPDAIRELIDYLNPEIVGLTGSWLLGFEREDSDVDLLIYGGSEIYLALADLAAEGAITDCIQRARLPRIYGFTLTDACFKGAKYTLRILRRLTSEDCKKTLIPLEKYVGPIRIIESSKSYKVPAEYTIILERTGLEAIMETWHTRYMELAPGRYCARLSLRIDTTENVIVASPDLEGAINVCD